MYRIGTREEFERLACESFVRQVPESARSPAALLEDSGGSLAFGLELRKDLRNGLARDAMLAELRPDQPVAAVPRGETPRTLEGESLVGEQT